MPGDTSVYARLKPAGVLIFAPDGHLIYPPPVRHYVAKPVRGVDRDRLTFHVDSRADWCVLPPKSTDGTRGRPGAVAYSIDTRESEQLPPELQSLSGNESAFCRLVATPERLELPACRCDGAIGLLAGRQVRPGGPCEMPKTPHAMQLGQARGLGQVPFGLSLRAGRVHSARRTE